MKRYQMLSVLLVMVILSVGSQAILAESDNDKGMKHEQESLAVVNNLCPIMGTEIDSENVSADLTRLFKEQKVGFCCTSCLAKWDELGSEEKAEKLEAAVSDKM